ncbi:hypothetical protein HK405_001895 [Cladochytrium tenue]|nr:hypothetical protein HK405_001895 [Cladochytrium tenue]
MPRNACKRSSMRRAARALAALGLAATAATSARAALTYTGTNEAGLEFGMTINGPTAGTVPGTLGTNYFAPNSAAIQHTATAFANIFRLNFAWERLQPTAKGEFDAAYLALLQTAISEIKATGSVVLLDVHNYARYNSAVLTSGDTTLADLWTRIANLYPSDSQVFFGLMNEPWGIDTATWFSIAQTTINAIRATGATNTITVPGNCFTGAHTWVTGNCDTGVANAVAALALSDSGNNLVFEMHQYFDADFSGTSATCTQDGAAVFADATNWLRTNGKKGLVGEMAVANNANCLTTLNTALNHLSTNSDVWLGYTWWAAGSAWGTYMFSIESTATTSDNAMFSALQAFGKGTGAVATSAAATTSAAAVTMSAAAATTTAAATTVATTSATTSTTAAAATTSAAAASGATRSVSGGATSCWSSGGSAMAVFNMNISPMPMAENGLATYTIAFTANGATVPLTVSQSWNIDASTVSGNTWSFTELDDQPNVGGVIALSGVTCTGSTFSPAVTQTVSATLNGGTVAVTSSSTSLTAGAAAAAAGVVATTSSSSSAAAAAAAGSTTTVTLFTTVDVTVTAGAAAASTSAAAAAAAATTSAAAATSGAPNYVLAATVGGCWGTDTVMVNLQVKISVNGDQPMDDANGGLANLAVTFGGVTAVASGTTWNVDAPTFSGNTWSFATLDDQPSVGGNFAVTGATCTNGALATPITLSATGALVSGGAINISVQQ